MTRLTLSVLLLAMTTHRCMADCSVNWTPFGDYCYRKYTTEMSWDNAQASCENEGGALVSIGSEEENQFVMDNFGDTKIWIGYVSDEYEGHFRWSDFSERNFEKWHSGEPNYLDFEIHTMTGGNNYQATGTWNNAAGSKSLGYVCKKTSLIETDYPEYWRKQAHETLQRALADTKLDDNLADNVIMFLGDGMSISTVTAARIMKGQNLGNPGEETVLTYDSFPHVGLSKTYNTDYQVPDSAGTATAYLTGVKTKKGIIGLDARAQYNDCNSSKGREVSSILKVAKEAGMAVGFVTSTRITHASPAGLYAHITNRHWEHVTDGPTCDDIAKQFVRSEVPIDVAFGGGWREFKPTSYSDGNSTGRRRDSLDLIQEWHSRYTSMGSAKYITTKQQLNSLDVDNVDYVLGLFNADHIDFVVDHKLDQPSMAEMTEQAIKILSKKGRRYFLFVEGGRIDHGHHINVANIALTEALALEQAVEKSMELTKGTNTLTIVTSDHSHTMTISGYPKRGHPILGWHKDTESQYFSDGMPYTTLNYATGPGGFIVSQSFRDTNARPDPSKEDTQAAKYIQSAIVGVAPAAHAGDDVAIFAHGPMSHLFHSVHEQNYIMHVMQYAACIGDYPPDCH